MKATKPTSVFLRLLLTLTATLFFVVSSFLSVATNPPIANKLINLSEGLNAPGLADRVPEIVVVGTTVHTIWIQYEPGKEARLYYKRSTDLGETWDESKLIKVLKDEGKAIMAENRRLAIDGENVHICIVDYDWDDNGTGRIFYFRSLDNGVSFESEKIIAATSGGYKAINNSFIKVADGKVAITYQGNGDKIGTWALFSSNGGTSFSDTKISNESNYVADLYFNGNQMIILYGYVSYSYGYVASGKVWVSVSQNGTSFTTNKISVIYPSVYGDQERCRIYIGPHYSSKITHTGNNIHVVFEGYLNDDHYTTVYIRSTNNGVSFEKAVDIGALIPVSLQTGSQTVAAMNNNVYLLAASTYPTNNNSGNQFYFLHSENNGNTFSEPRSILNPEIAHVGKASLPGITIDPNDQTGKTLYLTGNWLFSTKSVDGGQTFSGSTSLAPFLENNIINMHVAYMLSFMVIDTEGGKHWISSATWRTGTDTDIFYRNVKAQPEPGSENKALYVEDIKGARQAELVVVPSSESINFDSAMTAEAWIKFNPETQANFNILAKVNGYDGYANAPTGYQLGFQQDKGKIKINAGIKTDRGEFVHMGEIDLNDNLWHHIAFTYDANGELNNFKMYINGILHLEKTVIGAIVPGDGMLMIGSSALGNSWYYDAKYHIDDVRLWNRALTQEELLENQGKKLSGEENGLKLFLNFDDTFKDISGNGNDGIPVYNGTLNVSDFNPPATNFEMYQIANEISFNNKTTNATSFLWDFGNDETSIQGNPKHTYETPGEYNISLTSSNNTTATSATGHAVIEGLDQVEPKKSGNAGMVSIVVFGGGLSPDGTQFFLRKEGSDDIMGNDLYSPGAGQLSAYFMMNGAEPGKWDVVVKKNNSEQILEKTFTVIEAVLPEPWVSLSGRRMILYNMWQTYTLTYGNKGNIDALGVPLNLVISDLPGIEIVFFDFKVEANEFMKENTPEIVELMDTLYDVVEDYFGPGLNARYYPLYIPVIESGSSHSIHIQIKTPESFNMETWVNDPFFSTDLSITKSAGSINDDWPDEKTKLNACIALAAADAASSSLMDFVGLVLPVDCLYDFGTLVFNPWDAVKPDHKKSAILQNRGYALASAAISCVGDLSPIKAIKIGIKVTSILNNIYKANLAHQDCLYAFDPRYKNKARVSAVSSFDPNEMVGPSGFGDKNFIAKYNMMPYTVLFENKATATAPAHIVTISDTLDLSKLDISEFGFSSFGWGDTILSPPGNKLKEFSLDIDLRPKIKLINRVSAKLDTMTGIINWEFLSLNSETMNLEEDPFVGFLPPNKTSPEGEGFVSFTVGLKDELGTNSEIKNKASIIFDANEPIITNEYLNTLDLDTPESHVLLLEENTGNRFTVSWTGTDVGSEICDYSIYVMENDTNLYLWQSHIQDTSAFFEGDVGSTYKFYSIATDNVNNLEPESGQFDTQTTITVDVEYFKLIKEELTVFPNPSSENLKVVLRNAPCGMFVIELIGVSGSLYHSQIYDDIDLQNGVNINVKNYNPGQYILKIIYGNRNVSRKILIQ
ncbi:MAG: LamG-like jellyroll fold domain-containing protein [Prolixibacteraceae bacterium]